MRLSNSGETGHDYQRKLYQFLWRNKTMKGSIREKEVSDPLSQDPLSQEIIWNGSLISSWCPLWLLSRHVSLLLLKKRVTYAQGFPTTFPWVSFSSSFRSMRCTLLLLRTHYHLMAMMVTKKRRKYISYSYSLDFQLIHFLQTFLTVCPVNMT